MQLTNKENQNSFTKISKAPYKMPVTAQVSKFSQVDVSTDKSSTLLLQPGQADHSSRNQLHND